MRLFPSCLITQASNALGDVDQDGFRLVHFLASFVPSRSVEEQVGSDPPPRFGRNTLQKAPDGQPPSRVRAALSSAISAFRRGWLQCIHGATMDACTRFRWLVLKPGALSVAIHPSWQGSRSASAGFSMTFDRGDEIERESRRWTWS